MNDESTSQASMASSTCDENWLDGTSNRHLVLAPRTTPDIDLAVSQWQQLAHQAVCMTTSQPPTAAELAAFVKHGNEILSTILSCGIGSAPDIAMPTAHNDQVHGLTDADPADSRKRRQKRKIAPVAKLNVIHERRLRFLGVYREVLSRPEPLIAQARDLIQEVLRRQRQHTVTLNSTSTGSIGVNTRQTGRYYHRNQASSSLDLLSKRMIQVEMSIGANVARQTSPETLQQWKANYLEHPRGLALPELLSQPLTVGHLSYTLELGDRWVSIVCPHAGLPIMLPLLERVNTHRWSWFGVKRVRDEPKSTFEGAGDMVGRSKYGRALCSLGSAIVLMLQNIHARDESDRATRHRENVMHILEAPPAEVAERLLLWPKPCNCSLS